MHVPKFIPGAHQERLTEKQFQRQIEDLAALLGWSRKYHNLYAVGSDPGYPDLTLLHPDLGVLWLEVKGVRGRPSAEQVGWLRDIRRAGFHGYVVFPRDIEIVDALLRGDIPPLLPHRGITRVHPDVLPLIENEEKVRT